MKSNKRKVTLFVFLLGMMVSMLFSYWYAESSVRDNRHEAEFMANTYSAKLESMLTNLFNKTEIFETVIVVHEGEVPAKTFDKLSQSIMEENDGIRAIECLPNGVVTYCYPKEGNEGAIGMNVLENENRKKDALLAKNTGEITLAGPYTLAQGGLGAVAKNPIYLTNADGTTSFWGYSVIVLNLPEALDATMFDEIERKGYRYRLSAVVGGEECVIAESKNYQARDSLVATIEVPNNSWTLEISPRYSWYDMQGVVVAFLTCFCIIILLTLVVFLMEDHNEKLVIWADTDALTGLYNRRKIMDFLDIRLYDTKTPLAILYCDINDFKLINDSYGHDQGDVVLKTVAKRMVSAMQRGDVVARLGGDEFLIVLEHCATASECEARIDNLRQTVAAPMLISGVELGVVLGVGQALFPLEGRRLERLLRLSDERMYENKKEIKAAYKK